MAKRPVPLYDFKAFGAAIKAARNEYGESRKKVSDELYGNTAQMQRYALGDSPLRKNHRIPLRSCPQERTDSSCQTGPVSQDQIR